MFLYQDIQIHYEYINNNSPKTIVYLHGWGQNIEMMEPIAKPFKEDNNIVLIDLPGFGESEEPKETWSLLDYATMIHTLLQRLKIKNPIFVGHSFGGKIAIVYASNYKVDKLVLIASPYKVAMKKISLKVRILKKLAKIPILANTVEKIKRNMGSTDYRNATKPMRDILVKHVNTDVTENCKTIKCPTILLWGTKDTAVSLENAYELEKLIADSAVIVYENGTHYAYLEDVNKTIRIIRSFIS